jgi:hypothetical protein
MPVPVGRPDHVSAAHDPPVDHRLELRGLERLRLPTCRHTAGGLIEVATLMFGGAAVDDLVRVSGRQPS